MDLKLLLNSPGGQELMAYLEGELETYSKVSSVNEGDGVWDTALNFKANKRTYDALNGIVLRLRQVRDKEPGGNGKGGLYGIK